MAGLRADAAGARVRAAGDAGEGAGSGHGGRDLDHHGGLALHRPHELHPASGHRADGRLGGAERHQEGRHARFRLRPGHRRREGVHGRLHRQAAGRSRTCGCRSRIPDFSPFLQKVADAKPDALFVFVPSGVGAQFMKQFVERGLDKSGIKLIGPGDVTDDDSSTTWATSRSAPSPPSTIPPPMTARRTRRSWKPSRRPTTACARTSWRSAAMTACT